MEEAAIQYIYVPVRQVKRCICIEMVYQTSGEIYYLALILLKQPVLNDEDSRTLTAVRGGGKPIVFSSYQQSVIAHGYVKVLLMRNLLLTICVELVLQHSAGVIL